MILQTLAGVDYVSQLESPAQAAPAGGQVAVPSNRLIAAGTQIVMQSAAS